MYYCEQQRQAAAEVQEVESKRASLEQTLQSGLRDMNSESTHTTTKPANKSSPPQPLRFNADEEEEELNMNHAAGSGGTNKSASAGLSEELEVDIERKRQNEAVIQVLESSLDYCAKSG